jgi:KDO2-lipid IV(A) lauroyltransferase
MKLIKYFFEFVIIILLFLLFKLLGYKISSKFSGFFFRLFGPFFRSKKIIKSNIKKALPEVEDSELSNIIKNMWSNYGKILSDYIFIKKFRHSQLEKHLKIEGVEILQKIKLENKSVIFISGHFNNFELMAMQIEKSGINLGAIYRPLNNIFINKIMEHIRIKYICKKQIKKGKPGIREILSLIKKNFSIALMIDQRVSEGIKVNFFNQPAFTTTIPAQLVKRFNFQVVPVYIERLNDINYKMTVQKPINFGKEETIENITIQLNKWLEKMILKNPGQWIWSHNRWK